MRKQFAVVLVFCFVFLAKFPFIHCIASLVFSFAVVLTCVTGRPGMFLLTGTYAQMPSYYVTSLLVRQANLAIMEQIDNNWPFLPPGLKQWQVYPLTIMSAVTNATVYVQQQTGGICLWACMLPHCYCSLGLVIIVFKSQAEFKLPVLFKPYLVLISYLLLYLLLCLRVVDVSSGGTVLAQSAPLTQDAVWITALPN